MSQLPQELDNQMLVHLEWMFENQPELVRELHKKRQLLQHLQQKNQQTLQYAMRLQKEKGMSLDEALEASNQLIGAPPDGPAMSENPPIPVPYQEQKSIQDALEKQLNPPR